MSKTRSASVLSAAGLAGFLLAQAPSPAPTLQPGEFSYTTRPYTNELTLSARTDLVQIMAVVRDRKGNPVDGLTPGDFLVLDQGKPQTIRNFAVERNQAPAAAPAPTAPASNAATPSPAAAAGTQPRTVAFFFDDFDTPITQLTHARIGVKDYLDHAASRNARFGLFTASGSVTLDFTSDLAAINAALDKITAHPRATSTHDCPVVTPYQAYEVAEMRDPDATALTLAELMSPQCGCRGALCSLKAQQVANVAWNQFQRESKDMLHAMADLATYLGQQPGARVLVLASDGFITETMSDELNRAVDTALRSGVVVNALDAKGVWAGESVATDNPTFSGNPRLDTYRIRVEAGERFDSDTVMETVADGTGGTFIHGSNDLTAEVAQIVAPPAVEYSLGFVPEELRTDGQFHRLAVKLANVKGLSVSARPGYFAPEKPPVPPEDQPQRDRLRQELQAQDALAELPVTFGIEAAPPGAQGIQAIARFEPGNLPLVDADGHRSDEISWVAALYDAKNAMVASREGSMSLHLRNASLEYMVKTHGHFRVFLELQAPPGTYRLRLVASDSAKGQLSAVSQTVRIE